MSHLIEYEDANDEVRAVYDDIRATRKTEYINNFWKAIANHPPTLQRTWQNVKEVMTAPGELDPLTRELIYIAVSVTNGCQYCISSHTAAGRAKGMDDAIFGELMAIVATANATNRLANGYQIPNERANFIFNPMLNKVADAVFYVRDPEFDYRKIQPAEASAGW